MINARRLVEGGASIAFILQEDGSRIRTRVNKRDF
jgi:hypothetical protein